MRLLPSLLLLATLAVALPGLATAATTRTVLQAGDTQLRIEVVDVDDPVRVRLLQRWISEAAEATQTLSGRFPLRQAYVRIQQIDSTDDSPVPWGQTRRQQDVGVLLYVRRDATAAELRADWTAVHELSHLFHPYLGQEGRWLAEGLASYYQNLSRARAGMLSANEAWERLDAGFRRGERAASGMPLEAMGRTRGGTMRVYWAGAAFWLQADLALRDQGKGMTLDRVLDDYTRCCLRGTDHVAPADFIAALDRVAGSDVLLPLFRRHATARVFPSLVDTYARLGLRREAGGLDFSPAPTPAQLRGALMAPLRRSAVPGS